RARAAYQEQQAKVLAAAAALFGAKPNAEAPRSRLARLLELRTPGTSAPKPVLLRSRPMKPSDRLASLRKTNPSGREIYDSLTFRR
ncbi:MAG TPA: hypothetical protein PK095_05695, partial [Myxococcota bacterium]|nr:hypothetical protein [Myxococcota bacterium]